MKKIIVFIMTVLSLTTYADINPGQMAPNFTLPSFKGSQFELTKNKGSYVVLEWLNYGCPYVKKHYGAGNMQALQKEFTKKGVRWVSIISSAEGKQGYSDPETAKKDYKENGSFASDVLLDKTGKVGRMYAAKTTPHMFILGPDGNVLYNGAIDDTPSTDQDDIKNSKNFVRDAINLAMKGKKIPKAKNQPYGCSVKY